MARLGDVDHMPSAYPTLERFELATPRPISAAPGRRFHRPPTHVVLGVDNPCLRSELRTLLYAADHGSFEVVAEASDDQSARRFAHAHKPCVLVLALRMQNTSSLDAITRIRNESPHAHIVVLATQREIAGICQALRAGATGYVFQEYAAETLAHAVRCAAAGHGYLTAASGPRRGSAGLSRFPTLRGTGVSDRA
jgi:DNA-binding NarL/FixJ family response regulator